MSDAIELEKKANSAARSLMGEVGWPTIVLGIICASGYFVTLGLVATRQIDLAIAFVIVSLLTYAIYTVMHDAVHGSIQGKQKSFSWVNAGLGYLAGQVLFIPFKIHQQEHLAHHRHTNQKDFDPDLFVKDDSLKSLIQGTLQVIYIQYKYLFSRSWQQISTRDKLVVFIELAIMLAWRVAFIAAGFWWESLVLFVFGTLTGLFILVVLFVWLVHRPHDEVERYKNTTTILLPPWINGFVSWLWLFQNYHSIHHLFPRVPFYNYKKLFDQIEPIMVANQAPIVRIGTKQVPG